MPARVCTKRWELLIPKRFLCLSREGDAFSQSPLLSCFQLVWRAHLEGQQRVDLRRSLSRRRMAAVCAKRTAGIDVERSSRIATEDAANWGPPGPCRRSASTRRSLFQSRTGLGSSLGHTGIAHGVEEVFSVLVPVAKTPYREPWVKREASLGFGPGLFQFAQIGQRRREEEMG